MGLKDAVVNARWRIAGHRRPLPERFLAALDGLRGLEVGGPTDRFRVDGICPVYDRLASCDGVQWRADTAWHTLDASAPYAPGGRDLGRLHVIDGGALASLPAHSYDVVLSSHVIEHFANPLAALAAWRRVLAPEGWVLMIAPHRAGTFDHRRPVTSLEHLVEDHENGIGESDLTHLEETLRLHDRSRDADRSPREEWEAARRDNAQTRLLHHHVFDSTTLVQLLDRAGVRVQQLVVRHPHDICLLGRFAPEGVPPDNSAVLAAGAAWRRASPFVVDRAG